MKLTIIGLGAGSAEDLTLGAVRRLKELKMAGKPIIARTERHPVITALAAERITFDRFFDDVYNNQGTFDEVYSAIAQEVLAQVRQHNLAAYAVPGHPLFGEKTVELLLQSRGDVEIELLSGTSFIDACLSAVGTETTGLVVLDALTLPDPTNLFRSYPRQFRPDLPQLIYQVYDRQAAGKVKLALLEQYPFDHSVSIVTSAGVPSSQSVTNVSLYLLDRSKNHFDHLTSVFVPALKVTDATEEFSTLLDIMAQLRHPTKGCPWDREQTPETLKRYAIEEVYEVLEAIDDGNVDKYVEELGDLLLQVVFHSQLARETGEFTIEDVLKSISEKLIRRHPHVFGDLDVSGSDEVLKNWEMIKRAEKGNEGRKSRLDGVPGNLPALAQALEISKRAAKAGFEWESIDGVFDKVDEELVELREALSVGNAANISAELGDLLFTVVNLARFAKVDAEDSLRIMVRRFSKRFRWMEATSTKPLEELDQSAFEMLWQSAKREEIIKTST